MITWRTVQGPEQGPANQLAQAGANTSLQGLQALGAALKAPQAKQEQQAKDAFAQGLQLSQLSQGQQRIDNQNRQFEADQIFRAGQSALDRGLQQSLMKSTQGHDLLKLGMQHEFTDAQRQAAEAYDTLARGAGYKHAADMQDKGFTFKDGQLVKMQDHEIDMWNKKNTAAVKAATIQHGRGLEFLGKEQTFAKDQQGRAFGQQTSEREAGQTWRTGEREGSEKFTGEQNRLGRVLTASEGSKNRTASATRSANAVEQKIAAEQRKMDNEKTMLEWKRNNGYTSKPKSTDKKSKYMSSPGFTKAWERESPNMNPKEQANWLGMVEALAERYGDNTATMTALVGQVHKSGWVDSSNIASSPNGYEDAIDQLVLDNKEFVNRSSGPSGPPATPPGEDNSSKEGKAITGAKATIDAKRAARKKAEEEARKKKSPLE